MLKRNKTNNLKLTFSLYLDGQALRKVFSFRQCYAKILCFQSNFDLGLFKAKKENVYSTEEDHLVFLHILYEQILAIKEIFRTEFFQKSFNLR